jgi:hypothetical protein
MFQGLPEGSQRSSHAEPGCGIKQKKDSPDPSKMGRKHQSVTSMTAW